MSFLGDIAPILGGGAGYLLGGPIGGLLGASLGSSIQGAGAQQDASAAQLQALRESQNFIRQGTEQARGDIMPLFQSSADLLSGGYQGALGALQGALPQQMALSQGGNMNAQQMLMAALPQMQAAILGGNIDLSALQPQQLSYDMSWLQNAQMPQQMAQVAEDERAAQEAAGQAAREEAARAIREERQRMRADQAPIRTGPSGPRQGPNRVPRAER